MKKGVILMLTPVVLLLLMLISGYDLSTTSNSNSAKSLPEATLLEIEQEKESSSAENNWKRIVISTKTTDSELDFKIRTIITYALSLVGAPYQYSGTTPAGFDCSGFVSHVFGSNNIDIPHSSALQAGEGKPVAKIAAAPGDLVIFTGTNENIREPGHVGIVISEPGDTITFVHSSSNGGVKISKVQGTRYNIRFLQVRRVL